MNQLLRIARKEFASFFSSPIAFLFFGAFLGVTLFVFFWVETYFARNIADVRPLFEWMPVLLVFLSAAITMRMWSEERRAGTIEFLLTSPVPPIQLVLGKFLACLGLVVVALGLTLPLVLSVTVIGPLDWGPVLGGYLATLFLAAAYISIGLFVSARSENQIVSLILASLLGGLFYGLGSNALTSLFGSKVSEALKLMGSGARFESITRGVIDLRDLFYYLSLVGIFLSLNVYTLERQRWAGNPLNSHHRKWGLLTALFAANFLAMNLWLAPIGWARVDITEGHIYSISDATRTYLSRLEEPLLIRGYFSAKTHPLLAPLVPHLRDLLEEYAVAGDGRVRVEFVDPVENPELEEEAGQKYGISPVPFQFASKYQASVVNSYFDILVKYGDQFETLGFRDLIEVKVRSEADLDVDLRNPEYEITRSIKKVLYAYQGSGTIFDNIPHNIVFKGFISPDAQLPASLVKVREDLAAALEDLEASSGGKLRAEFHDPDANNGTLAEQLKSEYGFRPMALGLFSPDTFWFYMTLEGDGRVVQIPLPEDMSKAGLERGIQAALKRFSKGFLKTIAICAPEASTEYGTYMSGKRFTWLRDTLNEGHTVRTVDLKNGQVPEETDLLILVAPENLEEKQLFAVDQFLMQGGTVVLSTSPFDVNLVGTLSANKHNSGLQDWLDHYGIALGDTLVLDPQNAAFPIPVERTVGSFVLHETQMVEYPYFVDIREDEMDREAGITAGITQVTLTWPSPITVDSEKNKERRVIRLLESSEAAWTSESMSIQPDFSVYGSMGFPVGKERGRQLLAVALEGRFESYFKDKHSPLVGEDNEGQSPSEDTEAGPSGSGESDKEKDETEEKGPAIDRVIERSPESARIFLFASNSFLTDTVLNLASSGLGTEYLNPVQLVQNVVDWSLEDRSLLDIRGRTRFSRTLPPLDRELQIFWEYLNYALALFGLFLVWLIRRWANVQARIRYQCIMRTEGV